MSTGMRKSGDTFEFEDLNPKFIPSFDDKIRIALLAHYAYGKDTAACEKQIFKGDPKADQLASTFKQISTILDKGTVFNEDDMEEDLDADPYDYRFFYTHFANVVKKFMTNKLFDRKNKKDRILNRYLEYPFNKYNIKPEEENSRPFRDGFRKSMGGGPDKSPTIIVCVIGGITQAEIAQMTALREDGGFNLILGGTNVFSGHGFTDNYLKLNQTKRELAKKKREEEKRKKQEEKERIKREAELGALKLLEDGSDEGDQGNTDDSDEDIE